MHVERHEHDDLFAVVALQVLENELRVRGEGVDLLLVVLAHGVLVALLQLLERPVHLLRVHHAAHNLHELRAPVEDELCPRLLVKRADGLDHARLQRVVRVVREPEQPRLHRTLARELLGPRHILLLVRVHPDGHLGRVVLLVLVEFQRQDVVEALGQMLQDQLRVAALAENVQQIRRRHEIEAGVGDALGLQIIGETLLALLQVGKHAFDALQATIQIACQHGIDLVHGLLHQFLPLGVDAVEALRILRELHADVRGPDED
eukprot:3253310-Rhodomonas_salina.1